MAGKNLRITNKQLPKRLTFKTAPRQIPQIGRNEPCPCGSGKKYKDCHAAKGDAYLQELAEQKARAERKALNAQLKAEGVPWFKRLLGLR